jgi:hypothetical protein
MDTAPKFITSADVEKAITDRLRLIVIGIEDNEDYISEDPEIRVEFMRAIGIPENLIPSHEVEKDYSAYVTVTVNLEIDLDGVRHDSDSNLYEIKSIISDIVNESPSDYFDLPCHMTIDNIVIDGIQKR